MGSDLQTITQNFITCPSVPLVAKKSSECSKFVDHDAFRNDIRSWPHSRPLRRRHHDTHTDYPSCRVVSDHRDP